MTVSIKRMSAGDGFQYLMESVTSADGDRDLMTPLTRYYAETGTPPGRWIGAGLKGLDGGNGVEHGSQVTEDQLFRLLAEGTDPISGERLGRKPYNIGAPYADRVKARIRAELKSPLSRSEIARRVADLPPEYREQHRARLQRRNVRFGTVEDRAAVIARIKSEEREREDSLRPHKPVTAFDLTFSVPKSVSVEWAVADAGTQALIYDAHRQAVEDTLKWAEREVFKTRVGTNGVAEMDTKGVVAAAFDHWDSRANDPHLHTHVVVANRVQGDDDKWRTLFSRTLFKDTVTISEVHQGFLMDRLSESTGVDWRTRQRKHSTTAQWEIDGVSDELVTEFSQRSTAIAVQTDDLVATYTAKYGHRPSDAALLKLRQQATLSTRSVKHHHSLQELTGEWRERADAHIDGDINDWTGSLKRDHIPFLRNDDWTDQDVQRIAESSLTTVADKRATFARNNVHAEAARQMHRYRFASDDDRTQAVDRIVDSALGLAVLLSAPELAHVPDKWRDDRNRSRFAPRSMDKFTTQAVLDAEARLLELGRRTVGPRVDGRTVHAVSQANLPGKDYTLADDQARAVDQIATSGRVVDVLVGAAGTGKTTSMAGLRTMWEVEHGTGSVIGLAPSAAAADVLADDLGIATENTSKWLTETGFESDRVARLAALRLSLSALPAAHPQHRRLFQQASELEATIDKWRLHRGQLVIVDESSLAGTLTLDRLTQQAANAEAKVLLVGDWAQLGAVDQGGGFNLLVRDRELAPELWSIRRFEHDWEKKASRALRRGDVAALDVYDAEDRISEGSATDMLDAAYQGWLTDMNSTLDSLSAESGDGSVKVDSLLIAADNGTVTELNNRARADLVAAGRVSSSGQTLNTGSSAGVGDVVVTRSNERRLRPSMASFVKNGDRWRVVDDFHDGSLLVERVGKRTGRVVLPADYVAAHVELGYATTAHRAQGQTVDTAHTIVSGGAYNREVWYVAMTRARWSNRSYVDIDVPQDETSHGPDETRNWRDVLTGVLRNTGAEQAAHTVMHDEQERAGGVKQLAAEYETLAAKAQQDRVLAAIETALPVDIDRTSFVDSPAFGPLVTAIRRAESYGLHPDLPRLLEQRDFDDAADPTKILHSRVTRWFTAAKPARRQERSDLIAGFIPSVRGLADRSDQQALDEREALIGERARSLAESALLARDGWIVRMGPPPPDPVAHEDWMRHASTVAAIRDKWGIVDSSLSMIDLLEQDRNTGLQVQDFEVGADATRSAVAVRKAVAAETTPLVDPQNPDLTPVGPTDREVSL